MKNMKGLLKKFKVLITIDNSNIHEIEFSKYRNIFVIKKWKLHNETKHTTIK